MPETSAKFLFRVFQLCFIFLLPNPVVDGGGGEVWLQNSLGNCGAGSKAFTFGPGPLSASKGDEKGLCACV